MEMTETVCICVRSAITSFKCWLCMCPWAELMAECLVLVLICNYTGYDLTLFVLRE